MPERLAALVDSRIERFVGKAAVRRPAGLDARSARRVHDERQTGTGGLDRPAIEDLYRGGIPVAGHDADEAGALHAGHELRARQRKAALEPRPALAQVVDGGEIELGGPGAEPARHVAEKFRGNNVDGGGVHDLRRAGRVAAARAEGETADEK